MIFSLSWRHWTIATDQQLESICQRHSWIIHLGYRIWGRSHLQRQTGKSVDKVQINPEDATGWQLFFPCVRLRLLGASGETENWVRSIPWSCRKIKGSPNQIGLSPIYAWGFPRYGTVHRFSAWTDYSPVWMKSNYGCFLFSLWRFCSLWSQVIMRQTPLPSSIDC